MPFLEKKKSELQEIVRFVGVTITLFYSVVEMDFHLNVSALAIVQFYLIVENKHAIALLTSQLVRVILLAYLLMRC